MLTRWLLPCLALTLAAEVPVSLTAPIRRVRLHPDEAWVTRVGQAKVAGPGVHRLLLKDLPQGLELDDVRVAASGPKGSRLGDLSVGAEPRKVTETPEYKALKAEWEGVRDRQDALEAEGESIAKELAFLSGLQAGYDKEISARMTGALPGAAAVVDLSRSLQGRFGEVLTRDRRRRRELEKVREEFRRLDVDLSRRAAERSASPAQATVEVATDRAGEVEVEFTYRTRGAGWVPTYEARLAPDGRKLELAIFATIRQGTGEDWNRVQVEITNARSGRSLALAQYAGPRLVDSAVPALEVAERRMRNLGSLAPGVAQNQYLPAPRAVLDVVAANAPATVSEAQPLEEARGIAATWALEGTKDIPADNEAHRFRILGRDLEPALALVATPRLDPTVHRVARFPVPAGIPLFPGAAVVHYAGTQRVGQTQLEMPLPGAPFQFGFGPYRGVRVELRQVEALKEAVGTFTKDIQWTLRERMEVSNDTAEAVQVELLDREVRASSDKVRITPLPGTTPSREDAVPGVRAWTLAVEPRGKGTVALGAQIRIPAGCVLTGADDLHLPR
ncbi:mucoidy inhibitor MuiA family protein [Mesoterricola silvestris]|uniref:Mucoidy inhibitor MuiA family protein n=1 Tax=Mesoterricola silvestris TaxID=2927979 RepID=A0AA48GMZ6_9BACT|nr:mucoidy inhibitor MuiA family protein [Mesoterricola silvestris]BDU74319.1 hypothetical protein METEAL_34930 [Mesoterricola silvestris]